MSKAYDEGNAAGFGGKDQADNPYTAATRSWSDWIDGWNDAWDAIAANESEGDLLGGEDDAL